MLEQPLTVKELTYWGLPRASSLRNDVMQAQADSATWLLINVNDTDEMQAGDRGAELPVGSNAVAWALTKAREAAANIQALAVLKPLSDAIHEVDLHHRAARMVDRETLAHLGFPQLVRVAALHRALANISGDAGINPALHILESGGAVAAL